jgi:hypothetical protein
VLKLPLTTPKLKSIALHFPLGLEVTARSMKGVTIKDALDAIHKQFKKRVSTSFLSLILLINAPIPRILATNPPQADDEFEKPYLMGFEWDPEECYTRFIVHQSAVPTTSMTSGGGKKKKGKKVEGEEGS